MKQLIAPCLMALLLSVLLAACSGGGELSTVPDTSGAGEEPRPSAAEKPVPFPSPVESAPESNRAGQESAETESPIENSMGNAAEALHIQLTFGGNTATVQLFDTPASHEFLSRLPLALEFEDYVGMEKISYLSQPLTAENMFAEQRSGDFSYYAPWGNLAIFYNEPPPAGNGLVPLGIIESGKEHLAAMTENFTVTIEPAQ